MRKGLTAQIEFVVSDKDTAEVLLYKLALVEGDTVDFAALKAAKLVPSTAKRAKIVKKGELSRKLVIKGVQLTAGAKAAVEAVPNVKKPGRARLRDGGRARPGPQGTVPGARFTCASASTCRTATRPGPPPPARSCCARPAPG